MYEGTNFLTKLVSLLHDSITAELFREFNFAIMSLSPRKEKKTLFPLFQTRTCETEDGKK